MAAGLMFFCSLAYSQGASGEVAADGADQLREFLDGTQTLSAAFEQELRDADGELIETAHGSLAIRRPGRFAWRYVDPIEQLVVADGQRLWIYDAELSQATVTALDESIPASPAMLLSGQATIDNEFDVLESFEADGVSWVRLTPRESGSDFKEVLIGFRAGLLDQLRLWDSLDQVTTVSFSDVQVNPELAADEFEFVPPPGVDVIGDLG
jgi:outer membrane lipoprotein carrier protein